MYFRVLKNFPRHILSMLNFAMISFEVQGTQFNWQVWKILTGLLPTWKTWETQGICQNFVKTWKTRGNTLYKRATWKF